MSTKFPRISIDAIKHEKYKFYCTSKNIKEGETFRFETMADLLIISAVIGFYLNNFKPIPPRAKTEKAIKWDVLMSNEGHMHIIKTICLLHGKKDPKNASILLDNEQMAKILEGYANGGFTHLINQMEKSENIESNLLSLMAENFK